MSEYHKAWRAKNKDKHARRAAENYAAMSEEDRQAYIQRGVEHRRKTAYNLMSNYGITQEQYEKMLSGQGGGCAICDRPPGNRRLAVDHDHKCCPGTKTCGMCIRGLLCTTCNVWLGFYENEVWIARANDYLGAAQAQREIQRLTHGA